MEVQRDGGNRNGESFGTQKDARCVVGHGVTLSARL